MLAETELALGMNDVAQHELSAISPDQLTPRARALLGLALARQEKLDEARALASTIRLGPEADSALLYDTARLHARPGDAPQSIRCLILCLEATPPSQLDAAKARAKTCEDFAALAQGPAFKMVMGTQSKVSESACSGGSSCGTCSLKGSCGSSKEHPKR
ncbi:MAG: hypothetical protein AB1486_20865 [Planctomycetota bacterium]